MCAKRVVFLAVCLAFGFGCVGNGGKDSPSSVLADYVSQGFSVKSVGDKTRLMNFATGEVRESLASLNETSFKEKFVDAKRTFVSLKIKDERKVTTDQHSITYELTYTLPSSEKVTVKKHALFVKENNKWLISQVRNIKTFIEHQNELSF